MSKVSPFPQHLHNQHSELVLVNRVKKSNLKRLQKDRNQLFHGTIQNQNPECLPFIKAVNVINVLLWSSTTQEEKATNV